MEDEDWKLLSWVKRGSNRRDVLLYLADIGEPRTPTEIASQTDIHMHHVSRTLRDMQEKEQPLVTCINPEDNYDRRYQLTEIGEQVAAKLEELLNE